MTDTLPEIEALVFDLFGVMIDFDNDIVYARLARHCADPPDAFRRLNGLMAGRDVITGKLTLPQIHQTLVDTHGLSLAYPDFEAAWLEPYSWAMPGMADLVQRLSAHYPLVLLSNVDCYYWKVVEAAHPELRHFHAFLLSCELGLAKPDPEIFAHACRTAGAEPSRCLFVDDSRVNIDAARTLGLQTHCFRDAAGLLQRLREAGARGIEGSA